jgi:hypothetical protein
MSDGAMVRLKRYYGTIVALVLISTQAQRDLPFISFVS